MLVVEPHTGVILLINGLFVENSTVFMSVPVPVPVSVLMKMVTTRIESSSLINPVFIENSFFVPKNGESR